MSRGLHDGDTALGSAQQVLLLRRVAAGASPDEAPDWACADWATTILEQCAQLGGLLDDSPSLLDNAPSLRPTVPAVMKRQVAKARKLAAFIKAYDDLLNDLDDDEAVLAGAAACWALGTEEGHGGCRNAGKTEPLLGRDGRRFRIMKPEFFRILA